MFVSSSSSSELILPWLDLIVDTYLMYPFYTYIRTSPRVFGSIICQSILGFRFLYDLMIKSLNILTRSFLSSLFTKWMSPLTSHHILLSMYTYQIETSIPISISHHLIWSDLLLMCLNNERPESPYRALSSFLLCFNTRSSFPWHI